MVRLYRTEDLIVNVFGGRLRALRKEEGITMKELGKIIGVSESAIGMYERGEREPDHAALNKIVDHFNVTTDYLLGRSDFKDYTASDQEDFLRFKDDPALQRWFYELPKSPEEDLRKLKKMWDYLKDDK